MKKVNIKKLVKYKDKIYAYAYENAIAHKGRAEANRVLTRMFSEGLLNKEDLGEIKKIIKGVLKKVNEMSIEEQRVKFNGYKDLIKKKKKVERKGLEKLPNAEERKVVLRLAPFPSGALHIGNAKTYLLNALYAEKYKGKLLLVIDDTIGSKEKAIVKQAYKLIPEAFKWLGIKHDRKIIYKSDRLKIYYQYLQNLSIGHLLE